MNDEQTMFYLGGLFDGEGSGGVYKPCSLSCSMQMSDLEGLEILRRRFGGKISPPKKDSRFPNSRLLYTIRYSCLSAEKVLKELLPYLVIKHRQIEHVLIYWEKLKYTPKWAWGSVIQEYRLKLVEICPSSGHTHGRKKGSKDSYQRERSCPH